jgi:hypothetical protein
MKVSKKQVRENRMRIVETAFSRHHRDDMGKGCVMSALGTDAAPIKVGLERQLAVLGNENGTHRRPLTSRCDQRAGPTP